MKVEQGNEAIWYGKIVTYKDAPYRLTAIIKRRHNKKPKWYYQAELQDLTAIHSVVIADLEKVEIKEIENGKTEKNGA
jgi:hypothetical protein